jgi:hypothetical protein
VGAARGGVGVNEIQPFPPLAPAIEKALRQSITRFGVIVPVVKDQHNRILDGHHRARIADELGVSYRVRTINVADDAEAQTIARTLNADRRHLTEAQRREQAIFLRRSGHSVRAIAATVGVSKSQVDRDLATVPRGTVPEKSVGLDGKSRPSTRAAGRSRSGQAQGSQSRRPDGGGSAAVVAAWEHFITSLFEFESIWSLIRAVGLPPDDLRPQAVEGLTPIRDHLSEAIALLETTA